MQSLKFQTSINLQLNITLFLKIAFRLTFINHLKINLKSFFSSTKQLSEIKFKMEKSISYVIIKELNLHLMLDKTVITLIVS